MDIGCQECEEEEFQNWAVVTEPHVLEDGRCVDMEWGTFGTSHITLKWS